MATLLSLPSELISLLCELMPTATLKAFRCTCKEFAAIGEEYLFDRFEFRVFPSRRRLYQLERLAAHPSIASRLRCLSYESGVQLEYADYRYWQANVYQSISNARSREFGSSSRSKDEYAQFHAALQGRFTTEMPTKYDCFRWHLDHEAFMMAETRTLDKLTRIMETLSKCNSNLQIKLVMAEPQISLEDLENFNHMEYAQDLTTMKNDNPRRRVLRRRTNCLTHFSDFIEAATQSSLPVQDLCAVDLPHQLLTSDDGRRWNILQKTFRTLSSVQIKMSTFPHSDSLSRGGIVETYREGRNLAANRLARLLNATSNLQKLSLEFPEGREAPYSFEIFDQTNIDRFPRFWLASVSNLSLCHFWCSWDQLKALLTAAKNLTRLTLKHCRLERDSMIDLLEFLPSLKLKALSLGGVWKIDEDNGLWHSHDEADFTDCVAVTTYEGPYMKQGMRSKVEHFALNGGVCPLPRWQPAGGSAMPAELIWEQAGDTSWHYIPMPVGQM